MNAPDQPLRPELLDELLSADLDGEFDRAAADLGFTPEEARAALHAAPGAGTRRAALAQAREQLGTPPVLAPTNEHRLVTAALDHAADDLRRARDRRAQRRSDRSRRLLAAVGSAAAVIVVVVGLSSVATRNGGSKASVDSAASPGAATEATSSGSSAKPRQVGSFAFGDLTEAGALGLKVTDVLSRPTPEAAADSATPTTPAGAQAGGFTGSLGEKPAPTVTASDKSARSLAGEGGLPPQQMICIAAGARAASVQEAPVVTGTAMHQGRPAIVVVFRQGTSHVAYLLAVPGCAVIERVAVP